LVQPGFVDSDGFQKVHCTAKSDRSENELAEPYHEHYVNMPPFIGRLMRMSPATPESVANVVLKTMRRKRLHLRLDDDGFSLETTHAEAFRASRIIFPSRSNASVTL
jgi:hypothetical protein